ncbi:uncharacterized protein LOC62_02G002495 [Vanrija pseudolonga]|uniref:Uncharacterized protein n=1 Tax=Vanrija pseudolonga TaxID=143232 RepID=A0AAF1BGK4_9TREE|nr:hypothetical protein LOC62_02G002495 [Vanrija pseudolonga]
MSHATPSSSTHATTPLLDSQSFPEIIDSIAAYADYSTLLSIRATSKAMRKHADALLHYHLVLTTDEYPNESWLMMGYNVVMILRIPGIIVRSFSPDRRLYRIPALKDWQVNDPDNDSADGFHASPHMVMGSARAPVTGGEFDGLPQPLTAARVVDIMGHVHTNGIAALLHAAPNLHTTRYFGLGQGLSAVATGTPTSIVNTYLISPEGDSPRHPSFNYMTPTIGGTHRLVITIGYQTGNPLLSKGNVEFYDLPRDITDVVFAFRPAPTEVVEAQKSQHPHIWEGDGTVPSVSSPAHAQDENSQDEDEEEWEWEDVDSNNEEDEGDNEEEEGEQEEAEENADTITVPAPKIATGVLSEVFPKMALFFKSAYFKKLDHTIRFTFVGTEAMDPKIFGLAPGDDLATELLNGVEVALLNPHSEIRDRVKPFRALTDGEMEALRAVGQKHIICLTEDEFRASLKAEQYTLETPEF